MRLYEFIETEHFTKIIKDLYDDDDYAKIQFTFDPQQGEIIQGTGGLRKIRFPLNEGKSGGVRFIYYYADAQGKVFLITAYPKSKKDNLTDAEKAVFKKLVQHLKGVLKNG